MLSSAACRAAVSCRSRAACFRPAADPVSRRTVRCFRRWPSLIRLSMRPIRASCSRMVSALPELPARGTAADAATVSGVAAESADCWQPPATASRPSHIIKTLDIEGLPSRYRTLEFYREAQKKRLVRPRCPEQYQAHPPPAGHCARRGCGGHATQNAYPARCFCIGPRILRST